MPHDNNINVHEWHTAAHGPLSVSTLRVSVVRQYRTFRLQQYVYHQSQKATKGQKHMKNGFLERSKQGLDGLQHMDDPYLSCRAYRVLSILAGVVSTQT